MFQGNNNKSFKLTFNKAERNAFYGDTLTYSFGKLLFTNIEKTNIKYDQEINILIGRPDHTVAEFQKKLDVSVTSKTVSTIDLSFQDAVPARGELLLKTLLRIYNQILRQTHC